MQPSFETDELYTQMMNRSQEKMLAHPPTPAIPAETQPSFLEDIKPLQRLAPVFVARVKELNILNGLLKAVLTGHGRVVLITGQAGSGKTGLVHEFIRSSVRTYPNLLIASGNCNAHTGIGDPYLPFREILKFFTGDLEALWAAGVISEVHVRRLWRIMPITVKTLVEECPDLIDSFIPGSSLLERVKNTLPNNTRWLPRLEELVQKKGDSLTLSRLHQTKIFEQYTKVIQAIARSAPIVLILDDLQWADLGSISLLFHLGRNLSGTQIMVIGVYRQEEISLGRAGSRHPLEPVINQFRREFGDIIIDLDQADGYEFVTALLDSEPNLLGPSFRQKLFQQTGGHPLFTLELLRGMQEREDLRQNHQGCWVEGSHLDWDTLPARVEAVIAERIGRLPPNIQRILRVASVEGELFTAEVVAQICVQGEHEVLEILSRELDRRHHLVRARSINRIGEKLLSIFRFQHILFQKFLYNNLDEVERVHLHEQVAKALEDKILDNVDIPGEVDINLRLAWHYQEARIAEKAAHYLRQAAEKSLQFSAYQDALNHLFEARNC